MNAARGIIRRLMALFCLCLAAASAGHAEGGDRDMLQAAMEKPQALCAAQDLTPFAPLACGPATLSAVLRGYEEPGVLAAFFEGLGWALTEEGISFPDPAAQMDVAYTRREEIRRVPVPKAQVGGVRRDVEAVTLGHAHNHCTFIFEKEPEGPWLLTDCLYQFGQVRAVQNGENTWLVGVREDFATQETRVYEWWYNLATHRADIAIVREATTIAAQDAAGHTRAYVVSEPDSSVYAYHDERGERVIDHTVTIPSYASLCRWDEGTAGEVIRELDAFTQVEVYVYSSTDYTLARAGGGVYDRMSPATMRFMHPGFFLSGIVREE